MADKRKLLGDIERCHKKVVEGVDSFKEIWNKLHLAKNQGAANQREKYEQDLKKEIKKLQRLRDQIKSWCQSNEVKDKRALIDDRKLIEAQMESFKIVERDAKTKAYSKEALGLPAKLDPAERERCEMRDWLNKSIETLNIEVDKLECDVETIQAQTRKKKNAASGGDKLDELHRFIKNHRNHIAHLEALLRMWDNDTLEIDDVKTIQEEVEYYITDYSSPDFVENEYLYEDIVDPELLNSSMVEPRLSSTHSDNEDGSEDEDSHVSFDSHNDVTEQQPVAAPVPAASPPVKVTKMSPPSKPQQTSTPAPPTTRTRHPTPNSNSSGTSIPSTTPTSTVTTASSVPSSNTSNSGSNSSPPSSVPIRGVESKPLQMTITTPVSGNIVMPKTTPPSVISPPASITSNPMGMNNTNSLYTNLHITHSDTIRSPTTVVESRLADGVESDQEPFVLDPILGVSPLGPVPLTPEREMQLMMLEAASMNLPLPSDSNRIRSMNMLNSYHAQIPSHHYHSYDPKHSFDSYEYFKNLVPDTLFFIFYFYEGTKAQYYAAKALKEQHWRFHKKVKMWFQRYDKPKEIVESHETGTYVYFDTDLWQQRTKEDFKFEYKFLEENTLDD
eukprot:sb/3463088/